MVAPALPVPLRRKIILEPSEKMILRPWESERETERQGRGYDKWKHTVTGKHVEVECMRCNVHVACWYYSLAISSTWFQYLFSQIWIRLIQLRNHFKRGGIASKYWDLIYRICKLVHWLDYAFYGLDAFMFFTKTVLLFHFKLCRFIVWLSPLAEMKVDWKKHPSNMSTT